MELCDFFPQTAENIKRRSHDRRIRFMLEKAKNSKKFVAKCHIEYPDLVETKIEKDKDGNLLEKAVGIKDYSKVPKKLF